MDRTAQRGSEPAKPAAGRIATRIAAHYVSPTLSTRGYLSEIGRDGAVMRSEVGDPVGSRGKLFVEASSHPQLSRLEVEVVQMSRTEGELVATHLTFRSPTAAQQDAIVAYVREGAGRPCVVLVDDDPSVLEATRTFLARAGYRIVTVISPFEASSRISEACPVAVFMDYRMPGLDGAALIQFLRRDPVTRDLPVYFYSAADSEILREAVRASGANGYIQKGDGPFLLLDRLERIAPLKSPID